MGLDVCSDIQENVEQLLEQKILSCELVNGGGNNKIYRVTLASGQGVAVKHYFSSSRENTERLTREFNGLSYLTLQGEKSTPATIKASIESALGVYQWADGKKITTAKDDYILQASQFIDRLWCYSKHHDASQIGRAKDAFLSGDAIEKNIQLRLTRIAEIKELAEFVENQFLGVFENALLAAKRAYYQAGCDFGSAIPQNKQILSPSDFGLHNALVTRENKLIFLDFEYFGWDDPVTLVSHFLWHPGQELSDHQKTYFFHQIKTCFKTDAQFNMRLEALFPLFGCVWTLILLNEFIPAVWQRRLHAGKGKESERKMIQARQLERAKQYLIEANDAMESFPYGQYPRDHRLR